MSWIEDADQHEIEEYIGDCEQEATDLREERGTLLARITAMEAEKHELIADIHTIAHDLAYYRNMAHELTAELDRADTETFEGPYGI
jgi:hypothetical protein